MSPTIADIRFAACIEFLALTELDLPSWLGDYMGSVESALGDAYTEPANDVRGFIASLDD